MSSESWHDTGKMVVVALLLVVLTIAGVGLVLHRDWKRQYAAIEALTREVRQLAAENGELRQNSMSTSHPCPKRSWRSAFDEAVKNGRPAPYSDGSPLSYEDMLRECGDHNSTSTSQPRPACGWQRAYAEAMKKRRPAPCSSGTPTTSPARIGLNERILIFRESGSTEPGEREKIIYAWPPTTAPSGAKDLEQSQDSEF